jgi:hypothetical protein
MVFGNLTNYIEGIVILVAYMAVILASVNLVKQ